MAEQELLRDILARMEGKLDIAADNAILARQAAEFLSLKIDDHIEQDRIMHAQIDSRVRPLEHFRTKALTYLAVIGFVMATIVSVAKDAIAHILFPPHP